MDAQIPIVSRNDEILHYRMRKDVTPNDIFRATGLWIENNSGEVLIAQRAFTKVNDPGLWGPAVSGTVEEHETYETNVIKEVEEELGLTNVRCMFVDKFFQDKPRKHFCSVFKTVCDYPLAHFIVQKDEVEQIRWISKQQLKQAFQKDPGRFVPSMHAFIALFL